MEEGCREVCARGQTEGRCASSLERWNRFWYWIGCQRAQKVVQGACVFLDGLGRMGLDAYPLSRTEHALGML